MQVNVVQWHLELRELIEGGFLSTPIEAVLPVGHQITNIIDAAAVSPWIARRRIRKTGKAEPILQVSDGRVGNFKLKLLGRHQK